MRLPDPIADGAVIDYTVLGTSRLSIRANTSGPVGSVRFGYDATANYRTENEAPYTIAGDGKTASGGADYLPWTPATGNHTLTATPYPNADGTGTAGPATSLSFMVTNNTMNLAVNQWSRFFQEAGNGAAWWPWTMI